MYGGGGGFEDEQHTCFVSKHRAFCSYLLGSPIKATHAHTDTHTYTHAKVQTVRTPTENSSTITISGLLGELVVLELFCFTARLNMVVRNMPAVERHA